MARSVFALILAGLLMGCVRGGPRPEKHGADAKTDAGDDIDAIVAESLAKVDETAEAKEWLASKDKKHVLWKGNREQIARLVDDLYAAGAPKVLAIDISKEPTFEMCAAFAVILPTEPEARKRVVDTHNAFWKKYLEDDEEAGEFLVTDRGQRYLYLNFDL